MSLSYPKTADEITSSRKTDYDVITSYILERLEQGTIPWHKPWQDFGPAKNLISGKPYRGINSFLLGCAQFSSPFFSSFNQVKDLGGFVKKGAKSLPCVFWTLYETEDRETGRPINVPVLRYYRVFDIDQCEGLNHKRLAEMQAVVRPEKHHALADADRIIANMPNKPAIMSRQTKNLRITQKALGHARVSTTEFYTHVVDEEVESAMKNFRNGH